jgi:hypothetical protein
MTSYAGYPDGPRGIELGIPPIDTETWNGNCAAEDCDFVGDVDAAVFFLGIDPDKGRVFEYLWACPWCELEQKDETTDADRSDS